LTDIENYFSDYKLNKTLIIVISILIKMIVIMIFAIIEQP